MNKKLKSRKFIGALIWQFFIIGGFTVMFINKQVLGYFDTIVQAAAVITPAYLIVQGLQDINKVKSGNFSSRKVLIMILQCLYVPVAFVLDILINGNAETYTLLPFMNNLVWNAGVAVTAFMGIAWHKKGKQAQIPSVSTGYMTTTENSPVDYSYTASTEGLTEALGDSMLGDDEEVDPSLEG